MKEIKFRFWDGDKMHGPDLDISWFSDGSVGVYDRSGVTLGISAKTLMQFTGCLDRNGNPIYEGDIVQYGPAHTGEPYRELIKWNEGGYWDPWVQWSFWASPVAFYPRDLEVIGNIHEHPQLLTEKAKSE